MKTLENIIEEAFVVAKVKGEQADAQLPPEQSRGFDCGFAWVECRPGTSKLAKTLKKYGASKHRRSGVYLWNPAGLATQSIGPKYEGAVAFVQYLKENIQDLGNVQIHANSSYD